MSLLSAADTLWPALLIIALLPIYLMAANRRSYGTGTVVQGVIWSVLFLLVIYHWEMVHRALRWTLAMIGFASPLALGVISIRFIVMET